MIMRTLVLSFSLLNDCLFTSYKVTSYKIDLAVDLPLNSNDTSKTNVLLQDVENAAEAGFHSKTAKNGVNGFSKDVAVAAAAQKGRRYKTKCDKSLDTMFPTGYASMETLIREWKAKKDDTELVMQDADVVMLKKALKQYDQKTKVPIDPGIQDKNVGIAKLKADLIQYEKETTKQPADLGALLYLAEKSLGTIPTHKGDHETNRIASFDSNSALLDSSTEMYVEHADLEDLEKMDPGFNQKEEATLFKLFDADNDGVLDEDEYEDYLHGVQNWGPQFGDPDNPPYTDETWYSIGWPGECRTLRAQCDIFGGIVPEVFARLYSEFRRGMIYDDLRKAKAWYRSPVVFIFRTFDADQDQKLSKDEYEVYLHGIKWWDLEGSSYNDQLWDSTGWDNECQSLGIDCYSDGGVSRHVFTLTLYGPKIRGHPDHNFVNIDLEHVNHWRRMKIEFVFKTFDADRDGVLSFWEYTAYLHGMERWGFKHYTDARWYTEGWDIECTGLGADCNEGITKDVFIDTLYGQFRVSNVYNDFEKAKSVITFDAIEIFIIFDQDQDGVLSFTEYTNYLHGIGRWCSSGRKCRGVGKQYNDEKWYGPEGWDHECKGLKTNCEAHGGIRMKVFVNTLYMNYRVGKQENDLKQARVWQPDGTLTGRRRDADGTSSAGDASPPPVPARTYSNKANASYASNRVSKSFSGSANGVKVDIDLQVNLGK